MVNTEIRLIIFFVAKDGEYRQISDTALTGVPVVSRLRTGRRHGMSNLIGMLQRYANGKAAS